jgi:hypothetical protein
MFCCLFFISQYFIPQLLAGINYNPRSLTDSADMASVGLVIAVAIVGYLIAVASVTLITDVEPTKKL